MHSTKQISIRIQLNFRSIALFESGLSGYWYTTLIEIATRSFIPTLKRVFIILPFFAQRFRSDSRDQLWLPLKLFNLRAVFYLLAGMLAFSSSVLVIEIIATMLSCWCKRGDSKKSQVRIRNAPKVCPIE